MQKKVIDILLVLVLVSLSRCSATRDVKPLEKGETSASLSLGGPLIHFGSLVIPVPFSSLGVSRGLNERLTIGGAFSITDALFGVYHLETTSLYGILKPRRFVPGISVLLDLHWIVDQWEGNFRFYPVVDLNLYWEVSKRQDLFYLNFSNWFDFASTRSDGSRQTYHWVPAIGVGYLFTPGKWSFGPEIKYLAPGVDNSKMIVAYAGIAHTGALGIYFKVARSLK